MNKKLLLLGLVILVLLLSSCDLYYKEGIQNIREPEKKIFFLDGRWELESVIGSKENIDKGEAWFWEDCLLINNLTSREAKYALKNVNARDYLLYRYKTSPEKLGIETRDLSIFTIREGDLYLMDIIRLDEDRIMIYQNDKFISYRRSEEELKREEILERIQEIEEANSSLSDRVEDRPTGFIFAIKKPGRKASYNYRTGYLQINNHEDISFYEKDKIFLPRRNGFYTVDLSENGETRIRVESMDKEDEFQEALSADRRHILYIGNDYISLENLGADGRRELRVYPIDYLKDDKNIKLGDILEKESLDLIYQDLRDNHNITRLEEENFGLNRNKGYWSLMARLDDGSDHKLKTITPKSLVNYDELNLPMNYINSQIEGVEDVFQSPNKDYLIVRKAEELSLYRVRNNRIVRGPIYSLELDREDEIIMNEWAGASYSLKWEKEFTNNIYK